MNSSKRENSSIGLSNSWEFYLTSNRPLHGQNSKIGTICAQLDGFNDANRLGCVKTIEEFWGFWNTLSNVKFCGGYQMGFLKEKINEKKCCGKWAIHCDKEDISGVWMKCLLNLVGEQFHPNVIGAVLRSGCSNVVCIWMNDVSTDIKDKMKSEISRLLGISPDKILFQMHHQTDRSRRKITITIGSRSEDLTVQRESCLKCIPKISKSSSFLDQEKCTHTESRNVSTPLSSPQTPIKSKSKSKSTSYPPKPSIKIDTTNLPKKYRRYGRRVSTMDNKEEIKNDDCRVEVNSNTVEKNQNCKVIKLQKDIEVQPKLNNVMEKNVSSDRQNMINFVLASVLGMSVLILGSFLEITL